MQRLGQKRKPKVEVIEEEAPPEKTITEVSDELIDEIDSLLEESDVLVKFRQRGGE
jgi:hypothetical protein